MHRHGCGCKSLGKKKISASQTDQSKISQNIVSFSLLVINSDLQNQRPMKFLHHNPEYFEKLSLSVFWPPKGQLWPQMNCVTSHFLIAITSCKTSHILL